MGYLYKLFNFFYYEFIPVLDFPGGAVVKNPLEHTGDVRDMGLISWQPTPVFLSGKFPGQWSLAGYSLWSHKT